MSIQLKLKNLGNLGTVETSNASRLQVLESADASLSLHQRLLRAAEENQKLHDELEELQIRAFQDSQQYEIRLEQYQRHIFPEAIAANRLRVLFIVDDSVVSSSSRAEIRRIEIQCLGLREVGVISEVCKIDDEQLLKTIPYYSLIVLSSIAYEKKIQEVIEKARVNHVNIVFDTTDSTFGEILFKNSDYIIGSSATITSAASKLGKLAYCFPNVLHPKLAWLSPTLAIVNRFLKPKNIQLISYTANNTEVDIANFNFILPVLRRVLSDFPHARLLVIGDLDMGEGLSELESQLVQFPFLDAFSSSFLQALATVNISPKISPKSESSNGVESFFNAAVCGVPTVASPSFELQTAIRSGKNGFIAETEDEWYNCITKLFNAKTQYYIGKEARRTALSRHSTTACSKRFAALLSRMVSERWVEVKFSLPLTNPSTLLNLRGPNEGNIFSRISRVIKFIRHSSNLSSLREAILCRSYRSNLDSIEKPRSDLSLNV